MEMNTRLQVEHPVTEEITGVDLVEWQLLVASGEKLPKRQDELAINGWAMEARLYAEDPSNGFLPSVGRLERFQLPSAIRPTRYMNPMHNTPAESDLPGTARIETGIEQGDTISPYYDPMIAKLICHADDRLGASLGLAHLAADVETWPVRTNATFLHALVVNPDFIRGKVHTGFIAEHEDDVVFGMAAPPQWLLDPVAEQIAAGSGPAALQGFRLNAPRETAVRVMDRDQVFVGHLGADTGYDKRHYPIAVPSGDAVFATLQGATWRLAAPRHGGDSGASVGDGSIVSPMPGKIIALAVKQGEAVTKGQKLVTLEAMKMEHSLTAPFDGIVAELNAVEGAQVSEGALLARIEKED
jgi:3-methylcrotonyl-CoA carboxylase alpha subunit